MALKLNKFLNNYREIIGDIFKCQVENTPQYMS